MIPTHVTPAVPVSSRECVPSAGVRRRGVIDAAWCPPGDQPVSRRWGLGGLCRTSVRKILRENRDRERLTYLTKDSIIVHRPQTPLHLPPPSPETGWSQGVQLSAAVPPVPSHTYFYRYSAEPWFPDRPQDGARSDFNYCMFKKLFGSGGKNQFLGRVTHWWGVEKQ